MLLLWQSQIWDTQAAKFTGESVYDLFNRLTFTSVAKHLPALYLYRGVK